MTREARAEKETIHMTNAETNYKVSTAAEQGAHAAPEAERSSKSPETARTESLVKRVGHSRAKSCSEMVFFGWRVTRHSASQRKARKSMKTW